MTDPVLQMYIPSFMIVCFCIILFWKQFRKITRLHNAVIDIEKIMGYDRVKRIKLIFWLIFSAFGVMTIVYTVLPEYYFMFIPLDVFHHPIINAMGLLILKIGIVWIVIAQIHIDKELYKYSRNIENLSAMELVRYSEKMLITGMLVFFIGFFTTITNLIGFLLVTFSFIFYYKFFFNQFSHRI